MRPLKSFVKNICQTALAWHSVAVRHKTRVNGRTRETESEGQSGWLATLGTYAGLSRHEQGGF